MMVAVRQDGDKSMRRWWQQPLHPGTTLRGLKVALLVGTILTAINQGDVLAASAMTTGDWTKILLNYCVPFLVLVYADLKARTHEQRNQDRRS